VIGGIVRYRHTGLIEENQGCKNYAHWIAKRRNAERQTRGK